MPIISTETDEPIAALVAGFKPVELGGPRMTMESERHLVEGPFAVAVSREASQAALRQGREAGRMASPERTERNFHSRSERRAASAFLPAAQSGLAFPPAYEICVYPLSDLLARQRQLRWQIIGTGAIMLLGGFAASQFASARLAMPVEKLAVDSAENLAQRELAEAALERTSKICKDLRASPRTLPISSRHR